VCYKRSSVLPSHLLFLLLEDVFVETYGVEAPLEPEASTEYNVGLKPPFTLKLSFLAIVVTNDEANGIPEVCPW
jgi:hypothetical protein